MKNLKWIRLVPDQPGKGGWKSGIHSFQITSLNDIRTIHGFHVYRGAWRRDPNTQSVAGITDFGSPATAYSIHAYTYPSLTDPSAVENVRYLGHINYTGDGTTRYWDFTNGTNLDIQTGPVVPATFINIGGRCFVFNGAREGWIYDKRTAAIHFQSVQNLGVEDPAKAPGYAPTTASPNLLPYAWGYIKGGTVYITSPDPNSAIQTILVTDLVTPKYLAGQPLGGGFAVYYAGVIMAPGQPALAPVSSNTAAFAANGTLSVVNGSQIMTLSAGGLWPADGHYCGLSLNVGGRSYPIVGYNDFTNTVYDINGNLVLLAAQQVIVLGLYDGPSQSGLTYTVTGVYLKMPAGGSLTTTNVGVLGYSQSTQNDLVKVAVYAQLNNGAGADLYIGNLSWGTNLGPRYAYALYDPESGHISNLSPLYQIPNIGPVTQDNVMPTFPGSTGDLSYPAAGNVAHDRYSHILFFRTLTAGGSTFFPIGSLQPYIGKTAYNVRGSWNPKWLGLPNEYTDLPPTGSSLYVWNDLSTDQDLLVSGGLIGPQYTNSKPLVTLAGGATATGHPYAALYWDQRLWVVNTEEPDKIAYSCDSVQCPFGIPEESFPPTNFLRLPSSGVRVIGMRLVGEMALITTEKFAYTIVGNNESNYRLVRISARMAGAGTYQMDDFPSDVEGQPSVVYFLGRDRIVYEWVVGSNARPISREIQDQLDNILYQSRDAYLGSRVHCSSSWGRRLVTLSLNAQAGQQNGVFVFDVDNRVWTQNPIDNGTTFGAAAKSPYAFASVYGLDPPIQELVAVKNNLASGVTLRRWGEDWALDATDNSAYIQTFPMTFDGKKSKKSLFFVNIHSTAPSTALWTVTVTVDESSAKTYNANAAAYPDSAYSIYGPANVLPVDYQPAYDFSPGTTWQDLSVLVAGFTANAAPPTGYRFQIRVMPTNYAHVARVFAIDIGYQDDGDGGVDP